MRGGCRFARLPPPWYGRLRGPAAVGNRVQCPPGGAGGRVFRGHRRYSSARRIMARTMKRTEDGSAARPRAGFRDPFYHLKNPLAKRY